MISELWLDIADGELQRYVGNDFADIDAKDVTGAFRLSEGARSECAFTSKVLTSVLNRAMENTRKLDWLHKKTNPKARSNA